MNLPRYDAYIPSGIEWIGEIPAHWGEKPIRAIFHERNEKNEGIKTDFILSVTKDRGVIPYDEKGNIGNKKSENIENYKLVYPGDFVINKMNVVIGSLGFSKYFGAFSHVYLVYRPRSKDIYLKYFSYIFHNPKFYKGLIKYCTGIMELRESLNKDLFKQIKLPLPPQPEQKAIADFLDRKTALIDKAVSIKERLIERLKERRQILIHRAITHGLDPDAPMKDSGVAWIGEIPAHWEIVKLKWISRRYAGGTPDRDNIKYWENGTIPWIASGEVNQEIVKKPTAYITEMGFKNSSAKWIPRGSLVIALAGQGKTKGTVAFLDIDTTGNQSLAAIVPNNNKVNSKFLFFYLKSAYKELRGKAGEGKRDGLNLEIIGSFPICVPANKKEQDQIVQYIEAQTQKIDDAIALLQKEIDRLKEYKASLIDSVVTGKVKVASDLS